MEELITMEQGICAHAQSNPSKVAAVCGDDSITYGELWQRILDREAQLMERGAKPRRPFVYRASQDIDFIVTYCALHHMDAIAVPLGDRKSVV